MAQVTEAVYAHGVLKPKDNLALREAQRVRLIIEPIDDDGPADRSAALRQLREGIERMAFFSREPLPSRDELHDRALHQRSEPIF
jgi:predicted DNA-binding antitoxin AbrB/MazE fold protein